MKNKFLVSILLFAGLLTVNACATSKDIFPTQGGEVDTLHNDVHVDNYDALVALTEEQRGKDASKTYHTDDDGLEYKWDADKQEYVCISEKNTKINFYFDNTQTTDEEGKDAPIFTIKWYMLKPLGDCPVEINTLEKVIALGNKKGFTSKETYPTFIGWSFYSTCLDEEQLWNFETDYRQQAVTAIYGIWVG